jgi:hypothetical protein
LAGEEAHEGAALEGNVIADGASEHGAADFERVEDRALCCWALDFEFDFALDAGERS